MAKKGRKQSIRLQKQHIIASAIVLVLAVLFIFGLTFLSESLFSSNTTNTSSPEEEVITDQYRHPLSGAWQYEESDADLAVFGVMIENHYEARPQAGLEDAFLVIEAPVEAGISRMLAFYHEEQEVEKIGPVRSARPYYVDWAHAFDAMYVHVGGSPQALDQIATDGTFDLNEYWYGGTYFWRASNRTAPHNVYTSTELLNEAQEAFEKKGSAPERVYGLWEFKDASVEEPENPTHAWLYFSIYDWNDVYWEFDTELMRYKRHHQSEAHESEDGDQIMADNIAIAFTSIELIDDVGRREIDTLSGGDAYVLQDGNVIEATWEKDSKSDRWRFYNGFGEEIAMNGGVTWIEVLEDIDDIELVTEE